MKSPKISLCTFFTFPWNPSCLYFISFCIYMAREPMFENIKNVYYKYIFLSFKVTFLRLIKACKSTGNEELQCNRTDKDPFIIDINFVTLYLF